MKHRRHGRVAEEDSEINLTPMLDVVFIMLIFFIVTTSFVKEAGVEVNQPSAQTTQQQDKNNILIAITPEGDVWLDRQLIDVRAIRANVERLRAASPDSAVVIQADEEARTGILVKVMDQVRLAGVENVAIAAQPD
ncbi:MAG: biopolymer transporter ExbD [Salinisphaeraceae bacterium]|nr:biopolymer transporter ExbD [Salinisphaeraceae bacterium]